MEERLIWTILAFSMLLLVVLSVLTLIFFLVSALLSYMAKIKMVPVIPFRLNSVFLTVSRYSLIAAVSLWTILFFIYLSGHILYTVINY